MGMGDYTNLVSSPDLSLNTGYCLGLSAILEVLVFSPIDIPTLHYITPYIIECVTPPEIDYNYYMSRLTMPA